MAVPQNKPVRTLLRAVGPADTATGPDLIQALAGHRQREMSLVALTEAVAELSEAGPPGEVHQRAVRLLARLLPGVDATWLTGDAAPGAAWGLTCPPPAV